MLEKVVRCSSTCDISVLPELFQVSLHCCVFPFLPASRVLLKEKGKPPPGPPVQQPRGLASLFGQKQETPKLFKAMFGAKGKGGLAKLLQLKREQDIQVMSQIIEQILSRQVEDDGQRNRKMDREIGNMLGGLGQMEQMEMQLQSNQQQKL